MRRLAAALAGALLALGCSGPPPTSQRVLLVGLDGADWQLLDTYLAAGTMPELAALVKDGQAGVLETLQPPLSPLVWTTLMTGVSPLEHGILDFTRRGTGGTLEPIGSSERRVPALWNMTQAQGRRAAVFGLWATWPAEPVPGLMVTDRFLSFAARGAPPAGVVHPASAEPWARDTLAAVEAATDLAALRVYLPGLDGEEYQRALAAPEPYAEPIAALRKILIETRTYHRLATEWLAREKPELAIVYFQGTDTLGHVFAPFAPPRQATVSEADFVRFSPVPQAYFAEIDRLLSDYRRLAADQGATLVIVSDHGFHWGEGRPKALAAAAAATAGRWHRDEGIYLLWGPGISPSPCRPRAQVGQVAGSLLALLGLPPGAGLQGPVLPGVKVGKPPVAVDYRIGWHPAEAPATAPPGGADEVAKLRALGYLGSAEGAGRGSSTRTAGSFNNEGLLRRAAGDETGAARAFRAALVVDPANVSARWNLSELLFARGDRDGADALLLEALAGGLPEGAERVRQRAAGYAQAGNPARALGLIDGALTRRPREPVLHLAAGRHRLEAGECAAAARHFAAALAEQEQDPLAHASLGLARLCLGDAAGARGALARSLALDPAQPQVRQALADLGG